MHAATERREAGEKHLPHLQHCITQAAPGIHQR
jgi:hypothetical protein